MSAIKTGFKAPDLNAPRYRPKKLSTLNIELYKRFIKKFPKYKEISYKQFRSTIISFNTSLWNHAVDNRDGSELPEGLGYIFIGTCQPKIKDNPMYALSVMHNLKIKHTNMESDSFLAKIFYTNRATRYRFKMREAWMFKGSRDFKRTVSKEYPKNFKKYVQVDSFMHICEVFTKINNKQLAIKFTVPPDKDYNEFKMD